MRWKIIVVNAGIVLLIGVLSYVLLVARLGSVVSDTQARRQDATQALRAANAQLALDALGVERWLAMRVNSQDVREVFHTATVAGRQDAATVRANAIRDEALRDRLFVKMAPTLVLFVEKDGTTVGRNGSTVMRGLRLGEARPGLLGAVKLGVSASDIWLEPTTREHLFVAYAPVRDDKGEVLGAVVIGTPLNDDRLERTTELSSGRALAAAMLDGKKLELLARGRTSELTALDSPELVEAAGKALTDGKDGPVEPGADPRFVYAVAPLAGYGTRPTVVLVSAVASSLVPTYFELLWPVVAVTALGVGLVVVGGVLLGNYFSRPIAELEEGLLAVINGRGDLRFQIEHAELGGLVFRINSLLNQVTGVEEDTTDDTGRPSRPPSGRDFQDALAVDESSAAGSASAHAARALADEPAAAYYDRVFREYIQAKRRLGDPTDHITQEAFVERLKATEADLAEKQGRPVRYQVDLRDNAVVLVAVPLPR